MLKEKTITNMSDLNNATILKEEYLFNTYTIWKVQKKRTLLHKHIYYKLICIKESPYCLYYLNFCSVIMSNNIKKYIRTDEDIKKFYKLIMVV
jgi:hypothetical protein